MKDKDNNNVIQFPSVLIDGEDELHYIWTCECSSDVFHIRTDGVVVCPECDTEIDINDLLYGEDE